MQMSLAAEICGTRRRLMRCILPQMSHAAVGILICTSTKFLYRMTLRAAPGALFSRDRDNSDTGGEFGVRFTFAWNSPGIWLDRGSSGPHSPFLPPVVGAATNSPPVSRMAAGHRAFRGA